MRVCTLQIVATIVANVLGATTIGNCSPASRYRMPRPGWNKGFGDRQLFDIATVPYKPDF